MPPKPLVIQFRVSSAEAARLDRLVTHLGLLNRQYLMRLALEHLAQTYQPPRHTPCTGRDILFWAQLDL
jgi:hypothetical protein